MPMCVKMTSFSVGVTKIGVGIVVVQKKAVWALWAKETATPTPCAHASALTASRDRPLVWAL